MQHTHPKTFAALGKTRLATTCWRINDAALTAAGGAGLLELCLPQALPFSAFLNAWLLPSVLMPFGTALAVEWLESRGMDEASR